jgi:hypothetical protein
VGQDGILVITHILGMPGLVPCHYPKSFHFGDAAAFERNGRFNRMREILPAIWRFEIRMDDVSPSPISDLKSEIGDWETVCDEGLSISNFRFEI